MILRAPFAIAAALLSGCASLSTVQTAHTLRPGESQIGVHASLVGNGIPGLSIDTGQDPPAHAVGFPLPQGEIEVRHGFAPRWDAGFRLFLLGAAGDVKFQFLQGEHWDAAFAPGGSLSYVFLPVGGGSSFQAGELDVTLPILFGRHIGKHSSFVFGPKVQARNSFSRVDTPEVRGRGSRFLLLGGGAAVLNLGIGHGWSIPLELSVYNDWTEKTGVAYSAGFGLSFATDARPRWRSTEAEDE